MKKIKYNEDGLKVKWVEIDGKKIKSFERTKSDRGRRWNQERGESIENRLNEIQNKIYSENDICRKMREVIAEILRK